ncbi:type 1 glutamine amidotransferase [Aquirhabdus parva]|uniref:Type 1 glutamine amidotransferase n=1 Tax=Aquirhabdus parva TaxID=2283318 RepID=A0A345P7I1_9GAMM|nr:type 1 glutamine amidotransferase [Aquirhabdus parva]AXI03240.1 type 1 glutamine amidotransferase [Aquirhabdus parva]
MVSQPLRVHYFQHIKDEGLGSPAVWLEKHHAQVTATSFFKLEKGESEIILPAVDDVDLLIVMGGEMSVNDEDLYPWLIAEKKWIRRYIDQGKPVVGLCLGAQLIASSLGAVVKKNSVKEIGWWPVWGLADNRVEDHFKFPKELRPLSWHEDTFDLPDQAILLAESAACAHQAFQYGRNVLGFQFHPESTPLNMQLFLADVGYQELGGGAADMYIQTAAQMAAVPEADFEAPNQLLERALDFVLRDTPYI